MSSDCAFAPVGRSVSSLYTFPDRGLARRCLSTQVYHSKAAISTPQGEKSGKAREGVRP